MFGVLAHRFGVGGEEFDHEVGSDGVHCRDNDVRESEARINCELLLSLQPSLPLDLACT